MNQRIWTDVHLFATNMLMTPASFTERLQANDILIGDIVDLANCKRTDVTAALYTQKLLAGKYRYLSGNHERSLPIGEVLVINKTLFTHGDFESNSSKWLAYRKKAKGAGFFKRGVVVNAIELVEKLNDRPTKLAFLDKAAARAVMYNCSTYVCGHFHPEEKQVITHKGIRIIILPRGLSEVEV